MCVKNVVKVFLHHECFTRSPHAGRIEAGKGIGSGACPFGPISSLSSSWPT